MTLREALSELHEWIEAAKRQDPGAILDCGCKGSTALPALEMVVAAAEMTIATKYNIGDVVWVIHRSNIEEGPTITRHYWFVWGHLTVEARRVGDNGSYRMVDVDYFIDYGDHRLWQDEDICFPTREAAQAECDRRNEA
jgi:hypothetical protein